MAMVWCNTRNQHHTFKVGAFIAPAVDRQVFEVEPFGLADLAAKGGDPCAVLASHRNARHLAADAQNARALRTPFGGAKSAGDEWGPRRAPRRSTTA